MEYRIKLLPPDIDPAAHQRFAQDLATSINEPDLSLKAFHLALKEYFPSHSLLGLSSGTAALHLALQVLGVKKGDDVICPTFTFAATVNAILYLQARPVFIDSEKVTWNMEPSLLEAAIREGIKKGKKPAAILLVHAYGTPAQVGPIREIAKAFHIPLLEDAAPAFHSFYQGQMAGTFGDCGVFSFNYNKLLTTAGGGLLISQDSALIGRAQYLANQAREQAPYYIHHAVGYNYRMSGLSAVLGTVQLLSLPQKAARKKEIFFTYKNELQDFASIRFQELPETIQPNYWLTSFLLKDSQSKEKAFSGLQKAGIECRMLWNPMHLQPAFRHFPAFLNGVAESLLQKGLSLPSAVSLTGQEQEEVIRQLKASL